MLLYTPMPMELVMEGADKVGDYQEVDYNGIKILVEPIDMSSGKIVRVLSTDPKVYLNSSLSPGTIIKYKI